MASLLDSPDGFFSLLGNIASGGRVGSGYEGPVNASGDPTLSPAQRQTGLDALTAMGAALSQAGARGYGPAPTLAQGLSQGLLAGSIAAQGTQDAAWQHFVEQQQLASKLQDEALKRVALQREIDRQEWSANALKQLWGTRHPAAPGQAPAQQPAVQGPPAAQPAQDDSGQPGMALIDRLGNFEGDKVDPYRTVNWANYAGRWQIGAPLAYSANFYSPAAGEILKKNEWKGSFNIAGFPQVRTLDDFLTNPDAQKAAYLQAMSYNNGIINQKGYDRYIGQTIGGVPITRDGLLAAMWGGEGRMNRWLSSGGKDPAPDGNGTSIQKYFAMGAQPGQQPQLQPVRVAGPGAPTPAPTAAAAAPAGPQQSVVQLADQGPAQPAAPAPVLTPGPAGAAGVTAAPTVPGPVPIVTAPRPAATGPGRAANGAPVPAAATGTQRPDLFSGLTDEQIIVAMGSKDPMAELGKILNTPLRIETFKNPQTGEDERWSVDNQSNRVARQGLAPQGLKTIQVLGDDGITLEERELKPNGDIGKFIAYPKQDPAKPTEVYDRATNTTRLMQFRPGQGYVDMGEAPPPPESRPIDPARLEQNVQQVLRSKGFETRDFQNADTGRMEMWSFDPAKGERVKFLGPAKSETQHVDVVSDDGMKLNRYEVMPTADGPKLGKLIAGNLPFDPKHINYFDPASGRNVIGVWTPGGIKPSGQAAPLDASQLPPTAEAEASRSRQAGATTAAQKAEDVAADEQKDLAAGARAAVAMRGKIDLIKAGLSGVRTGPLAQFLANVGGAAGYLGLDPGKIAPGASPSAATSAQIFQKAANELVLSQLGGEGMPRNNFSNTDRTFLEQMMPQLGNTPEANRTIAEYLDAMHARVSQHARDWFDWSVTQKHGTSAESWRTFENNWNDYIEKDRIVRPIKSMDELKGIPKGRIWYTTGPDGALVTGVTR